MQVASYLSCYSSFSANIIIFKYYLHTYTHPNLQDKFCFVLLWTLCSYASLYLCYSKQILFTVTYSTCNLKHMWNCKNTGIIFDWSFAIKKYFLLPCAVDACFLKIKNYALSSVIWFSSERRGINENGKERGWHEAGRKRKVGEIEERICEVMERGKKWKYKFFFQTTGECETTAWRVWGGRRWG